MTEQFDDIDRDALERCVEIAKRDPFMAMRIEGIEDWLEGAEAAAYHCQIESLGLRPWQEPPAVCDADDPNERAKDGQALLRRLLDAGLSRYEPDPLAALRNRNRLFIAPRRRCVGRDDDRA